MKKSTMFITGILFALSSIVARADHGDQGSGRSSSGGDGQGHQNATPTQTRGNAAGQGNGQQNQNATTTPVSDDAAHHANAQGANNDDQNDNDNGDDRNILTFGGMVGVDGAFVNSDAIRGVLGDELPWSIRMGRGSLSASGHLRINVRGLVFTKDPSVPPDKQGINDEPTFRGLVSCLSEQSGGGGVMTVNAMTNPFPATPTGDSEINGSVNLPAQCIAPIVFVMSGSEDKWFAVIGNEP